jgi:hypothetical protein
VFGRQGYPNPLFRQGTTAALGGDSTLSVLITPQIGSFRYDNLWNTDLRASKVFRFNTVTVRACSTRSTSSTPTRRSCETTTSRRRRSIQ